MSGKYIVRQPIRDAAGNTFGHEILYHGANQAFSSDSSTSSAEFAAANTIYNFLTDNSPKVLKGTLNFMTFTTMLLMKKTPRLFDKSDLVIQIDDAVIIHPLSMHLVQQYAKEGYRIAVNDFQFTPGISPCWTTSTSSRSTPRPPRRSPSATRWRSPTA